MSYLILFALAILPVVVLMVYIYRQDKYQKEPVKSLIKAFVGGILAIPLDMLLVYYVIRPLLGNTALANTVFFDSFLEAGIPEELCKFIIFMALIWNDKNFDEYFDGIVYAAFIGLGFACLENIDYVFKYGFTTGIVRALISVPGHFLFGVAMGYFLSLAKFHPEKRTTYLLSGLLLAMLIHGLFDWLLMVTAYLNPAIGVVIYIVFIFGDIKLWKLGLKYIRTQQENSRLQAEEAQVPETPPMSDYTGSGSDTGYQHFDWNPNDKN